MTQKALETAVRDLQKVICDLNKRIAVLETKIDDQSRIITQQSAGALNTMAEQRPVSQKTQNPLPAFEDQIQHTASTTAIQRPVRQARIKAAEKIVSSRTSTAPIKSAATSKQNHNSCHSPHSLPTSQTDRNSERNDPIVSSLPSPAQVQTRPQPNNTRNQPNDPGRTPKGELGKVNTARDSAHENIEKWQVVRGQSRRKKQAQPITIGAGKECDDLQAIERVKYIQAWSFRPETTAEKVTYFLNSLKKAEYYVKKRDIKTDLHASFLIGIPESTYDEVTSADLWPPGVHFVPWIPFRPRPRQWRGPESDRASPKAQSLAPECTRRAR